MVRSCNGPVAGFVHHPQKSIEKILVAGSNNFNLSKKMSSYFSRHKKIISKITLVFLEMESATGELS